MIVRQDDTLVCEPCYMDEGGDNVPRQAHRESYMRVDAGTCESCGCTIDPERVRSTHPTTEGAIRS